MPSPQPNSSLAELIEILGPAMARDVVRVFLETFPSMLHELGHGDPERSRRAAHGLKSSARQMGAAALNETMINLERRLKDPHEKVTPADLVQAAAAFAAAAPELRAFTARSRS